jgi:hypothetical protein
MVRCSTKNHRMNCTLEQSLAPRQELGPLKFSKAYLPMAHLCAGPPAAKRHPAMACSLLLEANSLVPLDDD